METLVRTLKSQSRSKARLVLRANQTRTMSAFQGKTFANQNTLPRHPVPKLEDTFRKYITTVEPYLKNDEERKQVVQAVEAIINDPIMKERQERLLKLEAESDSWLSEMWIRGCYLAWQEPLPINSNVAGYLFGEDRKKGWDQTFTAAAITHGALQFHVALLEGTVEPKKVGKNFICMDQYTRMFSLTRIPGISEDLLVKYKEDESKHIAILAGNKVYSLKVIDDNRKIIPLPFLHAAFREIKEDIKNNGKGPHPIPVLTSMHRRNWAEARNRLVTDPVNASSLNTIESSIVTVSLEEEIDVTDSECGKACLVGNGKSVWFDKSLTLRVRGDGNPCINIEHSWADAPVPLEMFFNNALPFAEKLKDTKEDEKLEQDSKHVQWNDSWARPSALNFNFNDSLVKDITDAERRIEAAIENSDVQVYRCHGLTKSVWKQANIKPDSAVQMALQLAYRRYTGSSEPVATYETIGMTGFLKGRTETCRVVSNETEAFVKTTLSGYLKTRSEDDRKKAEAALRVACDGHLKYIADGQNAKGIDRHMFGLRMMAKPGEDYTPELFKQPVFSQSGSTGGFIISSSNNSYIRRNFGGMFGTVMPNGYGVCYIPRDQEVVLCVESKRDCKETDSLKFCHAIEQSLRDVAEIAGVPMNKL